MVSPPVPLSQFVLKVHSRCDLACNHCYVYEHADQSWRGRPRAVFAATGEGGGPTGGGNADTKGLAKVSVILQGGEPLLLGKDSMRGVLETLVARIAPVAAIDLRIHT